jgi:hypothetical protein
MSWFNKSSRSTAVGWRRRQDGRRAGREWQPPANDGGVRSGAPRVRLLLEEPSSGLILDCVMYGDKMVMIILIRSVP